MPVLALISQMSPRPPELYAHRAGVGHLWVCDSSTSCPLPPLGGVTVAGTAACCLAQEAWPGPLLLVTQDTAAGFPSEEPLGTTHPSPAHQAVFQQQAPRPVHGCFHGMDPQSLSHLPPWV